MLDDAVFPKRIIDSAGQSQSVRLLDKIMRLFFCGLIRFGIFSEVVVVDLAILFHDSNQAGVLNHLAVLNPVGIRAHIMQTGLIAQEHAGAAVKYKGCLMASVLRNGLVQALDDVALLIEIVGASVNIRPLAIVRLLALHIVGGSDCIGVPAVPNLPLGIEGQVLGQVDGCAIIVMCAVTVFVRIPAGEGITGTGEGIGCQGRVGGSRDGLRFHASLTLIGIKGDRDGFCLSLQLPLAVVAIPEVGAARSGSVGEGVLFLGTGILAAVVELGGGDGNLVIGGRIVFIHIRHGFRPGTIGQNQLAGSLAAGNIRAACGRIDIAIGL